MPRTLKSLALVVLLVAAPVAVADVLIIDKLETAQSELPARGMTMDRVQSRFGAPLHAVAPVGDPPITRWEYTDFVVFFEHRHVIHSVEKRGRAAAPAS
jgi:hypothetical protein